MGGKSSLNRFETEIFRCRYLRSLPPPTPQFRCSSNRGSTGTVLPNRAHGNCGEIRQITSGFARLRSCEKCIEMRDSDGGMSLSDFFETTENKENGHRGVYSSTAAAVIATSDVRLDSFLFTSHKSVDKPPLKWCFRNTV